MNKSEAGKLGAAASKEIHEKQYKERVRLYNESPKLCKHCNNPLEYIGRHNTFCNRGCAATFNNIIRSSKCKTLIINCINCGEEIANTKYCSNSCQGEYRCKQLITEWKSGNATGYTGKAFQITRWLRKYLLDKNNNSCSKCGWNELPPVDNLPLV